MVLRALFLVLLMIALPARADELGYLEMPDEFVAYWKYYGRASGETGFDIRRDGKIEISVYPERDKPFETVYYKVFHIEDGYVYMIVEQDTHDPQPDRLNPYWSYYRLNIEQDPSFRILWHSWEGCNLSKKDMGLPAHVHWERVVGKKCKTISGTLFQSVTTYVH